MRNAWLIARLDLLIFLRSRGNLLQLLLIPVILTLVLGYALAREAAAGRSASASTCSTKTAAPTPRSWRQRCYRRGRPCASARSRAKTATGRWRRRRHWPQHLNVCARAQPMRCCTFRPASA